MRSIRTPWRLDPVGWQGALIVLYFVAVGGLLLWAGFRLRMPFWRFAAVVAAALAVGASLIAAWLEVEPHTAVVVVGVGLLLFAAAAAVRWVVNRLFTRTD